MTKKILVAYDGSDFSQTALDEARALAQGNQEVQIHILSVVTQIGPASQPGVALSIQREVAGNIRNELQEIEENYLSDIPLQTEVIIDDTQRNAGHKIVKYAEQNDIDLIIIGNRGLGNVKGILLGSVSSLVIQHAPCHVMVVK